MCLSEFRSVLCAHTRGLDRDLNKTVCLGNHNLHTSWGNMLNVFKITNIAVFPADVLVDMEMSNYVTVEGDGTMEVCAEITQGIIDSDIVVTFGLVDGTKAGMCICQ